MLTSTSTALIAAASLAGIVSVIFLAARTLVKTGFARPSSGRRLRIKEMLPLGRARQLYLVECDGREVLFCAGSGSDVLLGWLPPGCLAASGQVGQGATP